MVVILITGAFAPACPAAAGTDPAAFISNLGKRLQAVSNYTSPEQKLVEIHELFRENSTSPA